MGGGDGVAGAPPPPLHEACINQKAKGFLTTHGAEQA